MRRAALAVALGLVVPAVAMAPAVASADTRDFSLAKLGNPATDTHANARFSAVMNELGTSMVNWTLEPPETTGFSGFNFAFEYPITFINGTGQISGKNYWAFVGATPSTNLQMPGIHVRKGLPFSFEAGAKVNYLTQSNMVATTVEAKWALNEGFLYFPDVAIRGFGTQLIGAREFTLTAAGAEASIGHQFPILGMFTLTPYAGAALVFVAASSNVIDFSPGLSEQDQFNDHASGTSTTNVFAQLHIGDNQHFRYFAGLRLISYVVEVGAEASLATVKTAESDVNLLTFSAKLGIDF